MRKIVFLISIFFINFSSNLYSQATIKGHLSDNNGEPIIGATISLESDQNNGVYTNVDGVFEIQVPSLKKEVLIISYIGFQTLSVPLFLKNDQVLVSNYILTESTIDIEKVVISGKINLNNDMALEKMKMKSSANIDYISSTTISKTGDANVAAAVARVSGVSTSSGFIAVRGIGDRYIKTTINDLRIPTLDPFTNNIKLDMIPTNLINNIILTKTASADLPGDWAGAYLSIETKGFPDKLTARYESSFGYNEHTFFKNTLSSERSSSDWLGYDNGYRDFNHENYVMTNNTPTMYDQFSALGLSEYYKSIGITSNDEWNKNSQTYTKLGLVELGLLDKSSINNTDAYHAALTEYNNQYYNQAFDIINKDAVKSNQSLPNSWASKQRMTPLNISQNLSIGNQTVFFGKSLGYLINFRYYTATQYDPNSTAYKVTGVLDNGDRIAYDSIRQQISKETNGWSTLVNLAYRLNRNNSINLLFMPNFIGVNNVREISNYRSADTLDVQYITSIFYEERKQVIYQAKSDHYFPDLVLKMNVDISYTDGLSSAPDFKDNKDYKKRMFRYLNDDLFDSKINFDLPFFGIKESQSKMRFGIAYQRSDKKNDQYSYYLAGNGIDSYNLENQGISVTDNGIHTIYSFYNESGLPTNHTMGFSTIKAAYLMADYAFTPFLRASGGIRAENANVFTDVVLYNELGLASDDIRRQTTQDQINKPGKLNETSILPSLALIYKVKIKEETPINIKLNYGKTVARPSIRELSDVSVYDFELKKDVTGNPNLKMVEINNYDFRIEYHTMKDNNISATFFYKDFKNHIELVDFDAFGYIWVNDQEKSWLKGIELEVNKNITKQFDFKANITLVNSESKLIQSYIRNDGSIVLGDTITRTMYGQAPYIINGMLSYNSDSLDLSISLSYNIQGPRLVIAGSYGLPDVYELPRHMLDLKISKNLGKHFSTSFTIKDILDAPVSRAYKYNDVWIKDYDVYRYGTTYNISIVYKL